MTATDYGQQRTAGFQRRRDVVLDALWSGQPMTLGQLRDETNLSFLANLLLALERDGDVVVDWVHSSSTEARRYSLDSVVRRVTRVST